MLIHLIRHGHAGNRGAWIGEDADRPLTEKGLWQAEAIAEALASEPMDLLWTSFYVRCRETMVPLAARLDLPVVDHPHLAEGAYGTDALDALLTEAAAGRMVAACSHGDVIPEILQAAVRRGATLDGPADPRKGARYVLNVVDGAVTHITHHPRPEA
ncbi:MAG: phosphoglycerate mutase family protein [Aquihabitans sp.]